MINFCIFGVAGYVAPRHLEAIKVNGGNLIAAYDISDSVGILDRYNTNALYFKDLERFDRFIYKKSKSNEKVDYATICTPNYLHDSHAKLAMRNQCDVICEKPLVLNPNNLDALEEVQFETGKKVYSILQLRHHPKVLELRKSLNSNDFYDVVLTYVTPRGPWYEYSWKGDVSKSGGLATNIGVHLFDLLYFLFGIHEVNELHYQDSKTAAGYLRFKSAQVRWFLSTSMEYLHGDTNLKISNEAIRSMVIGDEVINFSKGFTDLHNQAYKEILNGNGFGLSDCRESIQITSDIRLSKLAYEHPMHPLVRDLI